MGDLSPGGDGLTKKQNSRVDSLVLSVAGEKLVFNPGAEPRRVIPGQTREHAEIDTSGGEFLAGRRGNILLGFLRQPVELKRHFQRRRFCGERAFDSGWLDPKASAVRFRGGESRASREAPVSSNACSRSGFPH
ncbi:MAG TPA: hypothetical protein VM120_25100 [Bryobacteraceae bacterium]|nr:hypothetical protein [Bryobacteraceae bacterium]